MRKRPYIHGSVAVLLPLFLAVAGLASASQNADEAGLQLYRTERFVIRHDASAAWATELGEYLESLTSQFHQQASLLGAQNCSGSAEGSRMEWLCLTSAVQADSGRPLHFKANYDTRLHRVNLLWTQNIGTDASLPDVSAFEPSGLTAPDFDRQSLLIRFSHEAAHQLAFDSGLQKAGVMYPLWVAEGLATNFESPGEELCFLGQNPVRQARLKELAARQNLLPLSRLAVLTETSGLSPEERIDLYAQAWGLFRFLALEQRPALVSYLRTLAALPYGQRSEHALLEELQHSFGSLAVIETEWQAWLANSLS
jgi:hypothetical protein